MKGGGGGGKRRWRVLVIGVLVLIILSTLVPLAFLLGLHNGFHSPGNFYFSLSRSLFQISISYLFSYPPGFVTVQSSSPVSIVRFPSLMVSLCGNVVTFFYWNQFDRINATRHPQRDLSVRVDEVLHRINPVLPKVGPFGFHSFRCRLKPSTFYTSFPVAPKN